MTENVLALIGWIERNLQLYDKIRLAALPADNGISAEIASSEATGCYLDGGVRIREDVQLFAKHSSQAAALHALDSVAELIRGEVLPPNAVSCSSDTPTLTDIVNGYFIYGIIIRGEYYLA